MQTLPDALAPLAAYRQFMLYRLVPNPKKPGKFTKLPCNLSGVVCDAHDPQHWTDAASACAQATANGDGWGVAFTFTAADPFFFLDIDSALGADGWSPVAQQLCAAFPGAAVELSQSRTGLHIFGRSAPMLHGCRNNAFGLELYTSGRFVALTGLQATGSVDTEHSAALSAVVAAYFPFVAGQGVAGDFTLTTEPVPEWRGPTDDLDLIRRACAAKSTATVFAGRASFLDLWQANADVLTITYPSPDSAYGASDADAALASHLAFWTGKHGERIERLMRQSALVRDKWEREDYLPRTISAICAKPGAVCQDAPLALPQHMQATTLAAPAVAQPLGAILAQDKALPPVDGQPTMQRVEGLTFVDRDRHMTLFAGCVWISDINKVLVPGRGLLSADRFRVLFGGFTFMMDDGNQRTTRNAFEAFTESQVIRPPMADTSCFRPDLPPREIIETVGVRKVNTYEPVDVRRMEGDATPFLDHLAKVIPDMRDRVIFMSYMAACVQHKGIKFQWAPLLQGVPGNGKTLFTRCVAEALGRRYVHWPKASKLTKEFNAWMVGKLLYGVEDIYTPHNKEEVFEELKPMITGGDGLEIEGKGVDQISMDICGNFMFNSNHKDGMRKRRDDRRFAMFFSPQQHHADLARDGMDGDYFPKLYEWLRADGYAIVADLLMRYEIPAEFNPAGDCHRAPITSSTEEAIGNSQGGVEQQILEAVAQGRPGFAGGWISSIQLSRLLDDLKAGQRITLHKRKDMMQHLGYALHRGLPDGRVNNAVQPDNAKTQLYILAGHPDAALTVGADIARAYTTAQGAK